METWYWWEAVTRLNWCMLANDFSSICMIVYATLFCEFNINSTDIPNVIFIVCQRLMD